MKNIEINQKEERPRVELVSTRGLVAGIFPALAGEPRRVRELQGTREEPEGHPERGEPTDSEHRQRSIGDRRDESRFATEKVERLGLAEGRDQSGQYEDHAHDCHQRRGDLQELCHDYTSLFGFGMCYRATMTRFVTAYNIAYMSLKVKQNRKSPYFRAFSGSPYYLIWIKKFSSPKMRNREFVFTPKIEYKLVAERSEANQNSLTFPTWCSRQESNLHQDIRSVSFCPLNYESRII